MLRGTNRLTNDVALAIETALPFSTSNRTGWQEVTPQRKEMCVAAAKAAIAVIERHVVVRKSKRTN